MGVEREERESRAPSWSPPSIIFKFKLLPAPLPLNGPGLAPARSSLCQGRPLAVLAGRDCARAAAAST
eukprot:947932-Rhodomonas_salina.3